MALRVISEISYFFWFGSDGGDGAGSWAPYHAVPSVGHTLPTILDRGSVVEYN